MSRSSVSDAVRICTAAPDGESIAEHDARPVHMSRSSVSDAVRICTAAPDGESIAEHDARC